MSGDETYIVEYPRVVQGDICQVSAGTILNDG